VIPPAFRQRPLEGRHKGQMPGRERRLGRAELSQRPGTRSTNSGSSARSCQRAAERRTGARIRGTRFVNVRK
jgi:hypothetical protein